MEGSEKPAAVSASGLSKSYGATMALKNVSIAVGPGEIHALLGENGAGKSTLVKIFSGLLPPDNGEMTLLGNNYRPDSIMSARDAGVSTAYQELSVLPNLSIAQNLLLPCAEKSLFGLNSRKATEDKGRAILEAFGLGHLDPRQIVSELALSDKQRIEIVRALSREPKFLILDEPTASLANVNWVFDLIRGIAERGSSVLYISHRLSEVRELCSRATILRNGLSIASVDLAGANNAEIFKMMVGRNSKEWDQRPICQTKPDAKVALKVTELNSSDLHDVSFELREGEVLGVAALEGQGQQGLFRILGGVEKPNGGQISVFGQVCHFRDPHDALTRGDGIALVPEERKIDGIFPEMKVTSNITIPILSTLSRFGYLPFGRERQASEDVANKVELNNRYLNYRINNLSGGNQQKAILARVLATGAKTLVLYDPTRGVDVGTKQMIYTAIRDFAAKGGSILFYSSELPELVEVADRCLIIYGGQVLDELVGEEIEEQSLVAGVTGQRFSHEAFVPPKAVAESKGLV